MSLLWEEQIILTLQLIETRQIGCIYYLITNFLFGFSCMALSDLTGEGESKLVLADLGSGNFNMKLLVFKGTQLVSGHVIWLKLKSILFWNPWR